MTITEYIVKRLNEMDKKLDKLVSLSGIADSNVVDFNEWNTQVNESGEPINMKLAAQEAPKPTTPQEIKFRVPGGQPTDFVGFSRG